MSKPNLHRISNFEAALPRTLHQDKFSLLGSSETQSSVTLGRSLRSLPANPFSGTEFPSTPASNANTFERPGSMKPSPLPADAYPDLSNPAVSGMQRCDGAPSLGGGFIRISDPRGRTTLHNSDEIPFLISSRATILYRLRFAPILDQPSEQLPMVSSLKIV